MKVLIAGPGTGKTTNIKNIIKESYSDAKKILILSFTNATVSDLKKDFSENQNITCYTLHSYALRINHLKEIYILDKSEEFLLQKLSKTIDIEFIELCKQFGCTTFNQMITDCTNFININELYAEENIGNLDLLIVDEFQDFNPIERQLVQQISKFSNETIILGDDDQSIYGFKDADPQGIIDIYFDTNNQKIEHENVCYRCPDIVVQTSQKLIIRNKNRIDKECKICNKNGKFFIKQTKTIIDTDNLVIEYIKEIYNTDSEASILILSPFGFVIDSTKEKLAEEKFDFVDFWNTKIEDETLIQIWWLKAMLGYKPLLHLIFIILKMNLINRVKIKETVKNYIETDCNERDSIEKIHKINILKSIYLDSIINREDFEIIKNSYPELTEYFELLDESDLINSAKDLLINFKPDISFNKNGINVMSIHKSKGLQADYVFILGLVDGILPNRSRGTDTIESQRRLLYVGMSRARKSLYIISNILWPGKYVNKVDKGKFIYDYRVSHLWKAKMSEFIFELTD